MSAAPSSASHDGVRLYWLAAALFLNIAAVGYLPPLLLDRPPDASLLVAPMGASALLMLVAPGSRYAQPWTVMIANTVAAAIGLAVPHLIASPVFASATALALAVAAMGMLRTIHPPSGGLALLAVSLGAQPWPASLAFVVDKVMLSSAVLVGVSIGLNRLARPFFDPARRP
ncbi:HPP family protein [Dyella sedimenti]|uniref:HPP family protein n=1 Tax=Dyella sedimenti TaxID=2919947 RepID=UPI001FA97554|nr:HPP family protein [Dyella sedimenti]